MGRRQERTGSIAFATAVLLAAALVGTGCGSDESAPAEPREAAEQAAQEQPEQDEATAAVDGEVGSGTGGQITRQDAERIAVEAVGEGRVTWSGREDDRGATWEIEVTRGDGTEVDVLIDAEGTVIP